MREKDFQRFMAKVGMPEGDDGCMEWQGALNNSGYGSSGVNGKSQGAHRTSYEHFAGPIPEGLFVCHKCDNRRCVRPDHLFVGTAAENMRDKVEKGRGTKGEECALSKLRESDVIEIRERYAAGRVEQKELAERFGVSKASVCLIVRGEIWSHVSGPITRKGHAASEDAKNAKMDNEKVRIMRERYAAGGTLQSELCREYGISSGVASLILTGKKWRSAPGPITKRRGAQGEAPRA